jgi:hypothetical protein
MKGDFFLSCFTLKTTREEVFHFWESHEISLNSTGLSNRTRRVGPVSDPSVSSDPGSDPKNLIHWIRD